MNGLSGLVGVEFHPPKIYPEFVHTALCNKIFRNCSEFVTFANSTSTRDFGPNQLYI